MEGRLRRLEVAWQIPKPRDSGPPFDLSLLSPAQCSELDALTARAAPPTLLDPHGLSSLTDFQLERLAWLGSVGKGMATMEPSPQPTQTEQDRVGVAAFYRQALHSDGSFALSRLSELQRQRLAVLEARLMEST